ncbi:MAG: hybrid sensor histidine kinase/response regulator [Phycisphaerales bacterium]|nr:hybrid sensor histidine kinase/response regulator [Phycisphaerales bacterium]
MSGDLSGFSMFDLFKEEARTHGEAISRGLVELESNPANKELIAALMRAAHSLKGAARIVGVDLAVGVAHAMEDAMVAVQNGEAVITPTRIDQLLAASDLLAQLIELEESGIDDWTMANVANADSLATDLRTPVTDAASEAVERNQDASEIPAEASSAPVVDEGSVRVTSSRLDQIMRLAGESLVASRRFQTVRDQLMMLRRRHGKFQSRLREARLREAETSEEALDQALREAARSELELAEHQDQLDVFLGKLEELADSLYNEVLGSRMRPFDEGISMFPRMVRDLSRDLGKKAILEIDGGAVPVDRDVLRELEAPLTHMLRNCVDHGVETTEERLANGKPEIATVKLNAYHQGGRLHVLIEDDGKGIDPEGIRRKVVDRGFADESVAEALTDRELYEFLFLPGFSTAKAVTDVSGRGVGLDVVQTMVQSMAGGVRISSVPGKGTTFHLTLPLTRSVVRALIADLGGESYAFPLTHIDRIEKIQEESIQSSENGRVVEVDGDQFSLLDTGAIMELDPVRPSRKIHTIITGSEDEAVALQVDSFLGEEDLLVRPLDKRFGRVPHLSSTAFRETGEPVLIVDVEDVLRSARRAVAEGAFATDVVSDTSTPVGPRVLVVDDSITVREAQRAILTRHGYEVDVAVDGAEGWERLQRGQYDLLITDVDMPGMNGIQFVQTLRAQTRFKDLPVAMVSYKDEESQRQEGLDAGATVYLSKHVINDSQFIDTVHSLLKHQ